MDRSRGPPRGFVIERGHYPAPEFVDLLLGIAEYIVTHPVLVFMIDTENVVLMQCPVLESGG